MAAEPTRTSEQRIECWMQLHLELKLNHANGNVVQVARDSASIGVA